MLWAEYIHLTSRPVGGVADLQMHGHIFCPNVTYCDEEKRFKAGQSIRFIAKDLDVRREQVEEVIRFADNLAA